MALYFNTSLLRTGENAKKYDAKVDTYFPSLGDPWKHARLLNDFDYTAIKFQSGRRIGSGFISSSVLTFDYDHIFSEGLITDRDPAAVKDKVEKAMGLKGENLCYLAIPSHRLNGMHILLPLDRDITDPSLYKALYRYVVSTHPLLDQQVKDIGRFFYGSALDPAIFKKYSVFNRGRVCPVQILEAQWRVEEAKRILRERKAWERRRRERRKRGGYMDQSRSIGIAGNGAKERGTYRSTSPPARYWPFTTPMPKKSGGQRRRLRGFQIGK
ncbi:MAG: hypothetical protein IIY98_00870 [Aeriscardovia sp.]|nr:hypothetical protein [Aeriscardovia sp.]